MGMAYGSVPPPSTALLTAVRSQTGEKADGVLPLSLTKPSWVVRTESNVRKVKWKRPEPACVVCHGTGKVDCHHCFGKGRTNCVNLEMLPKGEWPKWCRTCGGSGLGLCSRCLGTGEYRYIMGFHFMNRDSPQDSNNFPSQTTSGLQKGAHQFLNLDQSGDPC